MQHFRGVNDSSAERSLLLLMQLSLMQKPFTDAGASFRRRSNLRQSSRLMRPTSWGRPGLLRRRYEFTHLLWLRTIIGDVQLDSGDDTFDGRGGSVTGEVRGGTGDDTYITDNAALQIVELAGEGTDEVRSSVNYHISANIEKLTLIGAEGLVGWGNSLANLLTGTNANDVLRGLNGNDTINAGAGDDLVYGGAGNTITLLNVTLGDLDANDFIF
jgi:hypothetical protein